MASGIFLQELVFSQANIKENTKAPQISDPLCRKFTRDRWIPRTMGVQCGERFHVMGWHGTCLQSPASDPIDCETRALVPHKNYVQVLSKCVPESNVLTNCGKLYNNSAWGNAIMSIASRRIRMLIVWLLCYSITASKCFLHSKSEFVTSQGSTLSFLACCPKSHYLGWYRNFLLYWYLKLDNQVANLTCPKDTLGWIWRADDP